MSTISQNIADLKALSVKKKRARDKAFHCLERHPSNQQKWLPVTTQTSKQRAELSQNRPACICAHLAKSHSMVGERCEKSIA